MRTANLIKPEICELLGIADKTYYNWKQSGNRPIIAMLESYFDKEDLREYLDTGTFRKLEFIKEAEDVNSSDYKIIATILDKIESFVQEKNINREGFLIKIYRTLRDMPEDASPIEYLESYDMKTFESFKNVMYGSSLKDVIEFYATYLSLHEIEVMRAKKIHILGPLKSMRKHNAHMKD